LKLSQGEAFKDARSIVDAGKEPWNGGKAPRKRVDAHNSNNLCDIRKTRRDGFYTAGMWW
jgi:hypothetical protein